MSTRRYAYGPRGAVLAWLIFFVAAGVVFCWAAANGHRIRLFPTSLSIHGGPVYLLAAVSFAFVALGIAASATNRRRGRRELVIDADADADAFELPQSMWSQRTVRVERARVLRYAVQNTMGTKILSVITTAKPVHVSNRLVGEDGYQALLAWLQAP